MTDFPTYQEARRWAGGIIKFCYDKLSDINDRMDNVEAGVVAEGSISSAELANGAVTEGKLATGAVTSGKLGAKAVTTAKIDDNAVGSDQLAALSVGEPQLSGIGKNGNGAGYTIALLTANFGDPATIDDGFVGVYRDTTNNKTYHISVFGDAYYGVEETAVPAGE